MAYPNASNHDEENNNLLHKRLNLEVRSGKSSADIFEDQTPTPTRFIRNCEEVGLFDDLRHVNPFEETFRRAVEQNAAAGDGSVISLDVCRHRDDITAEESLHTPQVYAQLESLADTVGGGCCNETLLPTPPTAGHTVSSVMDANIVDNLLNEAAEANLGSMQQIEHHQQQINDIIQLSSGNATTSSLHYVQPQIITLNITPSACAVLPSLQSSSKASASNGSAANNTAASIPIQTVKPFILPKLAPINYSASTSSNKQPSSASLTPTSQLPIKERLKAIVNHNIKSKTASAESNAIQPSSSAAAAQGKNSSSSNCRVACTAAGGVKKVMHHRSSVDNCMERKRAAACRYRNKIRNEHKDLIRTNKELQAENETLKHKVKQLEQELLSYRQNQQVTALPISCGVPNASSILTNNQQQLQIPPATLHLVMNIPQLLLPAGTGASIQPTNYNAASK